MKKQTIIIASVLKPIDDTRMFEKLGISLSDSGRYKVVIIGYPTKANISYPNIEFIAHKPFGRLSLRRLLIPLKVLKKTFQVKHNILIVNTHELLIVSLLNRILFGSKICYDIRENYYRNIRFTDTFPFFVRSILAGLVRAKELITSPFFHWFFLAEKGYEKELKFMSDRYTILENKLRIVSNFMREKRTTRTKLLFTGTLGESTGVFEAIKLAKSLHELQPAITLQIIGYTPIQETLNRINQEVIANDFITLIGGNYLVPHSEILNAIARADFGIITYPSSPHTQNSMPTKLYEYVASQLPILLQNHAPWVEYCQQFGAAIILKDLINPSEILSQMESSPFYFQPTNEVNWKSEEAKLLYSLKNICP